MYDTQLNYLRKLFHGTLSIQNSSQICCIKVSVFKENPNNQFWSTQNMISTINNLHTKDDT